MQVVQWPACINQLTWIISRQRLARGQSALGQKRGSSAGMFIHFLFKKSHAANTQASALLPETKVTVRAQLRRKAQKCADAHIQALCKRKPVVFCRQAMHTMSIHMKCLHVGMQTVGSNRSPSMELPVQSPSQPVSHFVVKVW